MTPVYNEAEEFRGYLTVAVSEGQNSIRLWARRTTLRKSNNLDICEPPRPIRLRLGQMSLARHTMRSVFLFQFDAWGGAEQDIQELIGSGHIRTGPGFIEQELAAWAKVVLAKGLHEPDKAGG